MNEGAAAKIRELSQADIPIAQRRTLYNRMERRMRSGVGLKPGLVQKYNACIGSKKERFSLLKEFMIDESMSIPQHRLIKKHDDMIPNFFELFLVKP